MSRELSRARTSEATARRIFALTTSDKAPYLVTLIVALLGLTIEHAGSHLTGVPIIEYSCGVRSGIARCSLVNLSRTTMLNDLHLSVIPASQTLGEITSAGVAWHPPSAPPNLQAGQQFFTFTRASAEYAHIPLAPGASITLVAGVVNDTAVNLRVSADTDVRLERASLITYAMKNELPILFVLVGLWLTLLIAGIMTYILWPD